MITCGWCHTSYAHWQSNCSNCGGPLPPQPGMGLGPEPPDVPRPLPRGFAFRTKWTRNFGTLTGLALTFFASLMMIAMIKVHTFFALFPACFVLVGIGLFIQGRKKAVGILHAFRRGIAVEGKVHQVQVDTTTSVNERHPWKLIYQFPVGEELHEGSVTSFDSTIGGKSAGQPVWVLYVAEDPEQCTLYPPVKSGLW